MDNEKETSRKILTTSDIRKHARDWSLAGDVGLLAHLEDFSQNIIHKVQETQKNFEELVDEYEELHTKVGNVTNQFLALQNCQFVENRVYDEETPTEEKPQVNEKDEKEQEKLLLMHYKEAVEVGVKLLDTHFVEVQLPPNSDSDEDDELSNGNSKIWKPKNSCSTKKFPLLIGSAEWWADDNVGLGTGEQNQDSEKIVSESDTDLESLKSLEKKSSSASMENIKSSSVKPGFPDSSSSSSSTENLFGFDKPEPEIFSTDQPEESDKIVKENEKEEEESETAAKPSKIDNAFTRELMAKLSSVTHKDAPEKPEVQPQAEPQKTATTAIPPEVTTAPPQTKIKPPAVSAVNENLFDETDDSSDLFSSSTIPAKAVEKNLFLDAENDDDLFENDLFSTKSSTKKSMTPPQGFLDASKSAEKSKRTSANDLFDDLEEDEDTLFATAVKPSSKPTVKSSMDEAPKVSKSVWDDDGLFDDVQDDGLFDSAGLFEKEDNKKEKNKIEIVRKDSSPDLFSSKPETEPKKEMPEFTEDPFGFSDALEKTSEEGDDLFFPKTKQEEKKPKIPEVETEDEDSSLFLEKPKLPDAVSVSSSRSSLFEDVTASSKPNRLASVFEKDKTKLEEDLFNVGDDDELFAGTGGKTPFSSGKEKSSLFEDFDDDDDLFGMGKKSGADEAPKTANKPKESSLFEDLDDADLFLENPKPPASLVLSQPEPKSEAKAKPEPAKEPELQPEPKPERKMEPEPKPEPKVESKPKTVGKLNIPSSLKSQFESAAKHIGSGRAKPLEKKSEDSLDVPVEQSALLKCPSRDRAKIPGRRRPQSRRARQEAIRNSGTWDRPPSPEPPKESPVVSPSTDEEDFFKVPELDTNFEKEDQTIFKRDLFEWSFSSSSSKTAEDNLLFDGGPVLSPKEKNIGEGDVGVFGVDVGEESLFKASEPSGASGKKSLFDLDLEDDDDLFGGGSSVPVSTPAKKAAVTEKPKSSDSSKNKGNFVDPLGLMKD